MLLGAVTGVVRRSQAGGPGWWVLTVALVAAMAAGRLGALLHGFATITMRVNQTVSGLAFTISPARPGCRRTSPTCGSSARPPVQFTNLDVFGLKDAPIVGPMLFNQNALTYLSWVACGGATWYLFRTRAGLNLRSVGEARGPPTAWASASRATATRTRAGRSAGRRRRGVRVAGDRARRGPTASPRQRLDRDRAGDLRVLAARPDVGRRLPVRRRHQPGLHVPGRVATTSPRRSSTRCPT